MSAVYIYIYKQTIDCIKISMHMSWTINSNSNVDKSGILHVSAPFLLRVYVLCVCVHVCICKCVHACMCVCQDRIKCQTVGIN